MSNIKILIVEDELLIAENLALKLKKLGYVVVDIVSSGKAALKSLESEIPDLILMDISIKGNIDGIETAAKIRAKEEIPIVFLTAYADDKTLERAAHLGCYGYVIKPFKDRELHATIKVAINNHQKQTAIHTSLQKTIAEYSVINDSLQATIAEYSAKNHDINIDSLTKLPNQFFLRDIFEYLRSQYQQPSSLTTQESDSQSHNSQTNQNLLAMICLTLDRFERISNSLGKENGDLLIKIVAEKLTECTANFDDQIECAIVKLQDTQFAILLSKINHKKMAGDFATLVLDKIKQPFMLDQSEVFLTASMGISFYDNDKFDVELLLEQAQKAMQYAQQQGGNKYKNYTLALNMMVSVTSEDLSLETDLHYALKRKEFELYYQPKISLKTGKISSAEALIRWNHPQLGLLAPNKFIPIAEASSLIETIGEWVLKTACKQTKIWHQGGFDFLRIAINLSERQFRQLDLFHKLTEILFASNLESEFLELEFTEKILIDNLQANIQRLNLIKKLGIKISLDDFGTGYSSLGYLQQFPFDTLKIDRCFVKNIDRNSKNAVITKTIIEMAHKLDLKVVAEGIETEAELAFLVEHQCDEVQGYLLSRPLLPKEFKKLLLSNKEFAIANSAATVIAEED